MTFKVQYLGSKKEERDRFQVEFNLEERKMFHEMQLFLNQVKDSTALKQWAFYGWLSKSNHWDAECYFREKLLINERNNKRLGINVKGELENKFQLKIEELGWKL
ncbi:MAG TPA: hypothetical protein VKN74_02625 [Candidatus Mcinerneyibacterium sp.]|nr:hypothetical protein [Candidatus Mcinerneyibacterium sp.]